MSARWVRWGLVGLGLVALAAVGAVAVRAQKSEQPQKNVAAASGEASQKAGETQNGRPTENAGTQGDAYHLPPEKLAKAITLSKIRLALDIAGSVWGIAVLWVLLATRFAAGLERWAERRARRRWVQGLLFFAALLVVLWATGLPLDLAGHVASRHFGISVQRWGGWWGDQGKGLGLTVVVGTLLLLLFNWIVKKLPRRYWLAAWAVAVPLMVAGAVVSPFVERIFDKFEPLSEHHAALVARLEQVVAKTGTRIPPDRMFLMKASEKTNGLNAYVSGMGATKRVVVWDTTAGRIPDDEVLFIFAHETGHYVLHHIVEGMIVSAVALFFVFWACAGGAGWLTRRYGAGWGVPQEEGIAPLATRTGFVVLIFAVSIAGFVMEPVGNTFSRHLEHQADVYGQEAIHGIVPDPQATAVRAFNDLGEAWLEDPNPNAFVEFWLYNHPSVKNRANFAAHYDPWKEGGKGKYFAQ